MLYRLVPGHKISSDVCNYIESFLIQKQVIEIMVSYNGSDLLSENLTIPM